MLTKKAAICVITAGGSGCRGIIMGVMGGATGVPGAGEGEAPGGVGLGAIT